MGKVRAKTRRFGGELLREFIEKNGLQDVDAARMLKVAPSLVHYWTHGAAPRPGYRRRIQKWTRGEVPVDSWAKDRELDQIGDDDVQPLPKVSGGR
jgi:hypothetical protein